MLVHGPYPIGEPRVEREARVALERGFEVDVIAMRREGEPAEEDVGGVAVIRLPLAHRRGASAGAVVAEYVGFTLLAASKLASLSFRRRYDIVHVHNPPDFLVLAALLPKFRGAQVILDVHDLSPDMFAMRFEGRWWSGPAERVLRLVERGAAAAADAVVTVHEPYRRELVSRGVPSRKTTVVMNSLDERLLPPRPRERSADGFRVVYHGSITPPYGVHVLVGAAALAARRIPELRLEIYGEGDTLPAVIERAHELGIGDSVYATGRYLPHRDVLERISGAAVGVVPNLATRLNRFALSSKLFEYVALGVPVVCSALPTLQEHFSQNEILFYAPGDPVALAAALAEVAADPAGAAIRAERAARRYEGYRWSVSAERYAALLERLAGREPAERGPSPARPPRPLRPGRRV